MVDANLDSNIKDDKTSLKHKDNELTKIAHPPKKPLKYAIYKDELTDLFINKNISAEKIANLYGCSKKVILDRLHRYGIINLKDPSQYSVIISENELRTLYTDKELSIPKIAKLFHCSPHKIHSLLVKYSIERRGYDGHYKKDDSTESYPKIPISNQSKKIAISNNDKKDEHKFQTDLGRRNISNRENEIIQYFKQGYSITQLSDLFKLNKASITNIVHGIALQKTIDLFKEGKRFKEVLELLGLSKRTLTRWMKQYDLKQYWINRRDVNGNKINQDLISNNYLRLKTIRELSKIFHRDISKISTVLRNNGFYVLSPDQMNKILIHVNNKEKLYSIPVTSFLQEVIEGELLGDGYLKPQISNKIRFNMPSAFPTPQEYNEAVVLLQNLQKNNDIENQELKYTIDRFNWAVQTILNSPLASFYLHVSKQENEWVNHLNQLFLNNKYPSTLRDGFGSHDKNGNKLLTVHLTTPNTVQLYEIRQKWYNKQGTKIIPSDLILTPDKVLHWYIGDGSLKKRKNKDESLSLCSIELCTQGFNEEEAERY